MSDTRFDDFVSVLKAKLKLKIFPLFSLEENENFLK